MKLKLLLPFVFTFAIVVSAQESPKTKSSPDKQGQLEELDVPSKTADPFLRVA